MNNEEAIKPCSECGGSKVKITIRTPQEEYPRTTRRTEPCPSCQPKEPVCENCEHTMYCTHERKENIGIEGGCFNMRFDKQQPTGDVAELFKNMYDTILILEQLNTQNDGSYEIRDIEMEALLNELHNQWVFLNTKVSDRIEQLEREKAEQSKEAEDGN